MLLGEVKIALAEVLCVQTGIDVAFESQQGLASIVWGELWLPVAKASGVQPGQFVADAHQFGDLYRRQLAADFDQLLRLVQQFRLSEAFCRQWAFVIKGFCR
ncbi:hypothetical protein D3C72_1823940 [compost metagenome]